MSGLDIGKLYRWPRTDTAWTLYDNDRKWTNGLLSHKDIFLVLSFKKNDISTDFYIIKVLMSNGIIGHTIVHKSYVRKFVKLQ